MMISDELITFNLDIISADDDYDYFILTKIKIVGDKNVLEQFKVYKKKGESERFIRELMESCSQAPEISETRLVVGGAKLGKKTFSMQTKDPDLSVFVDVTSKKIGTDDGKFVVVNLEALLNFFVSQFELKT